MLTCPSHPKYKARFAPRIRGCKVCWQIWTIACLNAKVEVVEKKPRQRKLRNVKVIDKRTVKQSGLLFAGKPLQFR